MRGLSAKQERFAQLVFAGYRLANAYRAAYSTCAAPATVRVEASRLAANPKIIERIDELRAFASIGAVCAYQDRRRYFAQLVRSGACRDVIRAVREDSILTGDRPRRISYRTRPRPNPEVTAILDALRGAHVAAR